MNLFRSLHVLMRRELLLLAPWLILVSLAEAALIGGLRLFLGIFSEKVMWLPNIGIGQWFGLMSFVLVVRWLAYKYRGKRGAIAEFNLSVTLRTWLRYQVRKESLQNKNSIGWESRWRKIEESVRIIIAGLEARILMLQASLQLLVFLPLLFWFSWPLALGVTLIAVPLLLKHSKRVRNTQEKWDQKQNVLSDYEVNFFNWRKLYRFWTIKKDLMRFTEDLKKQEIDLSNQIKWLSIRKAMIHAASDAWAGFAVIVVLSLCGYWLIHGHMSVMDLLLFSAALILSYKPSKEFLRLKPLLRDSYAAIKFLQENEMLREEKGERNFFVKENSQSTNLRVNNIDFCYDQISVFQNLSFHIDLKNPIWITGGNGLGKTTLLRLLARLEKPQNGIIEYIGFSQVKLAFLSHHCEIPPVQYLQPPPLSQSSKLNELYDLLQISNLINKSGLSAGQKQKMAIYWVVQSDANILLLDEPLAFIALKDRELILNVLIDCAQEFGKILIFTHHDSLSNSIMERIQCISIKELLDVSNNMEMKK